MANRHLSRSIALQTLFEWDFREYPDKEINDISTRIAEEFAPGQDDGDFINYLLDMVTKKRKIIDEVITKAAPEWPLEKINSVDRNILRLGLAELLFGDYKEVPPKVALNESIELGKTYGGESSSRFINGVLGAVYKEIGEPGKEQKSKRQMKNEDVDPDKLPIEVKAGSVVYTFHNGKIYIAMVHDVFGYWTLSKGGVKEGETPEEAAIRELKKETDLDIQIIQKLGESEYIASHPQKGKIRKQLIIFLAKSSFTKVTLHSESGGLDDAKWFPIEEVVDLKMYDDVTKYIAQSIEIISQ